MVSVSSIIAGVFSMFSGQDNNQSNIAKLGSVFLNTAESRNKRIQAAQSLGKVEGNKNQIEAINFLAKGLTSPDSVIIISAINAIGELEHPSGISHLTAKLNSFLSDRYDQDQVTACVNAISRIFSKRQTLPINPADGTGAITALCNIYSPTMRGDHRFEIIRAIEAVSGVEFKTQDPTLAKDDPRLLFINRYRTKGPLSTLIA